MCQSTRLALNRQVGSNLMADISDVEQALVDSVISLLYPAGSSQSSIVGVTCRIYRGWPNAATLSSDLGAGVVNVTVVPDNESGKTATRYLPEWQYRMVAPSLTATVFDKTILIGGIAMGGNVVGALINGFAYTCRINPGDTPNLVAANLGAVIQANFMATVSGSSINIPAATGIQARVVCDSQAFYEGRRQEKDIRIIC